MAHSRLPLEMFGLKKICGSISTLRRIVGRNQPKAQTCIALKNGRNSFSPSGNQSLPFSTEPRPHESHFAKKIEQLWASPMNAVSNCRLPPPLVKTIIPWKFPLPVEIVDAPRPRWSIVEPTVENVPIKKEAARLIVIRRRKMKKHQLKKLRKRMFYEWAKIRHRREQRKEKAFQSELLAKIKDAEMFDAKAWVEDFIQRSNNYAKKKEEEEFYRTPEGFKLKIKMLKEARYVKPADWKD